MLWQRAIKGYRSYLQLERSLSENTVEAYIRDVSQLELFSESKGFEAPTELDTETLKEFVQQVSDLGLSANTQSRMVSGVRSFFKYLLLEDRIQSDPSKLLETPKIGRKLPETLSQNEVEKLIKSVDLSKPEANATEPSLKRCIALDSEFPS